MKRLSCLLLVLSSGCAASLPASPDQPSLSASASSSAVSAEPSAASPSPSVGPFVAEDLPLIMGTEGTLPAGMTIYDQLDGVTALMQPVALLDESRLVLQPGFVDARMTRLDTSAPGSYWDEGGYITWVALYQTPHAATRAFGVLVMEHEAASGWGMDRVGVRDFGEASVALAGPAYGLDSLVVVYVWRTGNLLLAAVAWGVTVSGEGAADGLLSIAEAMDARVPAPS